MQLQFGALHVTMSPGKKPEGDKVSFKLTGEGDQLILNSPTIKLETENSVVKSLVSDLKQPRGLKDRELYWGIRAALHEMAVRLVCQPDTKAQEAYQTLREPLVQALNQNVFRKQRCPETGKVTALLFVPPGEAETGKAS